MAQTLEALTIGAGRDKSKVTFLPEPEPRARTYTVISVDDHLVEPPETFDNRMPAKFAGLGPTIVEHDDGAQYWRFEDRLIPIAGTNAVSGRPPSEYSMDSSRLEHMRRGCWDVHSRVKDMDLAGLYASVCFPSMVAGFGGARFVEAKDPELGQAAVRAWNDWAIEEWAGAYPDRFVPLAITWLGDPHIAAAEVRRNATRGCRVLSFPDQPEKLGLPSIHTGYWAPIFEACVETGTSLNLHVGSSSWICSASSDGPAEIITSLFFAGAAIATADWLFSKIPLRYPELKIVMSEGGIGWLPALQDRIEHCFRYKDFTGGWTNETLHPNEVLAQSFWFCALDDAAGFQMMDRLNVDHIMVECDYPHTDSTWPDTQLYLDKQLGHLPKDVIEKVTWKNAADLYGLNVSASVLKGKW